jgi:hypothetical protein
MKLALSGTFSIKISQMVEMYFGFFFFQNLSQLNQLREKNCRRGRLRQRQTILLKDFAVKVYTTFFIFPKSDAAVTKKKYRGIRVTFKIKIVSLDFDKRTITTLFASRLMCKNSFYDDFFYFTFFVCVRMAF